MIETTETPEDVEKLLVEARKQLQDFEDSVDRKRLLARLKAQAPAHPVLLGRGMFAFLTFVLLVGAVSVLVVPLVNSDLARNLARFDRAVPLPNGAPENLGLPI